MLLLYGTLSEGIVMYSIGSECPAGLSETADTQLCYCQSWHATFHLSVQSEFEGWKAKCSARLANHKNKRQYCIGEYYWDM